MNWRERLFQIIENSSGTLTIPGVAEKAHVNVKSLYGYLSPKGRLPGGVKEPHGDVIDRLAKAVGLNGERELRFGEAENVGSIRRIPLIDMSKLGTLKINEPPTSVWDGLGTVEASTTVPETCFAVTLLDDGAAPAFLKGDVMICDRAAELVPGCYVVVVMTEEKRAYFGKFRPLAHGDTKRFDLVRGETTKDQPRPLFPTIEVRSRSKGYVLARAIKYIRDV